MYNRTYTIIRNVTCITYKRYMYNRAYTIIRNI